MAELHASFTLRHRALRVVAVLTGIALLTACSGSLQLLDGGKSYPGTWNSATGQIEATIDGTHYAGNYSDPPNVGIGLGVGSFGWGGTGGGVGLSTGTGGGGGRAIMTSSDGRAIQCFFATSFGKGQGECQGTDGRRFLLMIGG
ncbi:hypothetical protein QTI66_23525 [Variovorax sp. J22R133]|uniref:hypothetical protein n=1 Tax=Variovorax brevis TaxID=3053503 RepID=UPI0025766895|nr:hypothetical protein [Variovorax sp. J22R133]MDM0115140.1 hypothetical protein [Variovorax sp. J22R133]